jgi:hypothetical protein
MFFLNIGDVKKFKSYDNLSKEDALMVFKDAMRD